MSSTLRAALGLGPPLLPLAGSKALAMIRIGQAEPWRSLEHWNIEMRSKPDPDVARAGETKHADVRERLQHATIKSASTMTKGPKGHDKH